MREFKDLKIAVAGTGYVGLSIATLLSQHHQVTAVDIIPEKVDLINNKKSPIQDDYIEKYLAEKELNLTATLDAKEAYSDADFVVIAAPTNYDSKKNFFDTSAVEAVIKLVIEYNPEAIMVIKSTIPVGYTTSVREKFHCDNIIFSPEFLRESKALYDNLYPSRIIVGTDINNVRLVKAAHTFAELLQEGAIKEDIDSSVWNYESCVKHTIFVSQAGTILKSFHMVLDAITIVKKFYPNVQVKVAGPRIIEGNRLKGNSYGLFIKNKIQSLELENNVEFLGPQNEIQMKEHMLKSNVFVSASSIENSPNSLGEAMLLGMPCISSDVGGVSDLMQHNEEGYIYPADAPEMLAYYIIKVFEDGKTAEKYGKKARVHAMDTHNPQQNWNDLWKIYSKLMEESRKKG